MTHICDRSAIELATMIHAGELSARELLDATLERIERLNPQINAIVTLAIPEAQAAAHAADEAHAAGHPLGPLHGLPLAVKDLHDTAGIRTTLGSPIFADRIPTDDDLSVARLRQAGAVVFAKTNVPEFGAGSHTFNPVFGVTRNPYALDRSAGGSSGGAAAALAAGLTTLADGSDMGGSLRNPASFCNVVGHRPSPGRVPTVPAGDGWSTMGTAGPMGRTVADAALMLSVQAGPDPRSPIALPEPGSTFLARLPTRLDGLRIALSPDLGGRLPVDPEIAAAVEAQAAVLTELGATVTAACLDFTGAEEVFQTLRALAFVLTGDELADTPPEQIKETVRWNIAKGRALSGTDVARANALRTALFHQVRTFFTEFDALVLPASQALPFDVDLEYPSVIDGTAIDNYLEWMRAAYFVSATECPATAVPAGFSADGLPIGVQIVAPHRADLTALGIAHALEQAGRHFEHRPAIVTELHPAEH